MAFVCVSGDSTAYEYPHGATSGINAGELCCIDVANNVIIPATASLLHENVACVAIEDAHATSSGFVACVPVKDQLWEWDCTNSTASDQLCQRSLLTDAANVANTTTEKAVDECVVVPIANVGAASDKKQRGFIVGGHFAAAVS